jgi:hypothetical protein
MNSIVSLDYVPNGYEDIIRYYGDPDAPDFWDAQMERFAVPFPLRLSWDTQTEITRIVAHRLVGMAIVDALFEISQHQTPGYLRGNDLDLFGGTYADRNKRGIDEPSTHRWGIAIDLNPHLGPLGEEPKMPGFIVNAFKRRGFVWGGDFDRPDGMHFQAARGY